MNFIEYLLIFICIILGTGFADGIETVTGLKKIYDKN